MGKIFTTKINRFDGGMKNDVRDKNENGARLVKNFNIQKFPHRLQPRLSTENGNNDPTREIKNFLFAGNKIWGLGIDGSGKTAIYNKTNTGDNTWTDGSNNTGTLAPNNNVFIQYTYAGVIYIIGYHGAGASGRFYKFKIDNTGFTDSEETVNTTAIGQGILHSKDNRLYFPYTNSQGPKIYKNYVGSWTANVLALPEDYTLPILAEHGDYLAIACPPTNSIQKSRLFLWDRDSSVETIAASLDLGVGTVYTCAEVDGQLAMVVVDGHRLKVKVLIGISSIVTVLDIEFDKTFGVTIPIQQQQVKNNTMYFLMRAELDSVTHYGLWALGRNSFGEWFLNLEQTPENDTDPNSLTKFLIAEQASEETIFTAYNDGLGNEDVTFTAAPALYTATSIWESLKYDGGDPSITKKLLGVTVMTVPLPTAGQVVLQYKKDEETSWTTIFTNTTDNSIRKSAVNDLPHYKEIQFRIESTGNAEITGLKFKHEELPDDKY